MGVFQLSEPLGLAAAWAAVFPASQVWMLSTQGMLCASRTGLECHSVCLTICWWRGVIRDDSATTMVCGDCGGRIAE